MLFQSAKMRESQDRSDEYMLSNILPLYKKEHMDKLLGEQFWLPMYMAGAQCKTLNTDVCTQRSRQKIFIHAPYMWC